MAIEIRQVAKCDDRSWPPLTPSAATPTLVHSIKLNSTPGPLVVCEGNDGMYKSKIPLHPLDGPCRPVVSFHTLAKSDLPGGVLCARASPTQCGLGSPC